MWILGIIASGVLKKITDTFTRTVSGALGTTDTGQTWTALRGTWFATGSTAQSNNAAADYAIASISLSPNATINADTTGGCGPSFWITDSGSWWGAFPHYSSSTVTTCTGGTAYCYTAGCTPANSCGTISESSVTTCTGGTVYCYTEGCTPANSCGTISQSVTQSCTGPTVSCYSAGCIPNGNCGSITESLTRECSTHPYTVGPGQDIFGNWRCCSVFNFTDCIPTTDNYVRSGPSAVITGYTRSSASNVTAYTRSSATNVSVTTYTSGARIISSVSGTIATDSTTTLATSTSSYPNIASMQVNTNGTTITVKGYSAAGQTTQLGSTITSTPTTPVRGPGVGIIKAPTTGNQGSTLDNFNATA